MSKLKNFKDKLKNDVNNSSKLTHSFTMLIYSIMAIVSLDLLYMAIANAGLHAFLIMNSGFLLTIPFLASFIFTETAIFTTFFVKTLAVAAFTESVNRISNFTLGAIFLPEEDISFLDIRPATNTIYYCVSIIDFVVDSIKGVYNKIFGTKENLIIEKEKVEDYNLTQERYSTCQRSSSPDYWKNNSTNSRNASHNTLVIN